MPFLMTKWFFQRKHYYFNQKNKSLSSIPIIDELYVLWRFENLLECLLILQKLIKTTASTEPPGRRCRTSGIWFRCLGQLWPPSLS